MDQVQSRRKFFFVLTRSGLQLGAGMFSALSPEMLGPSPLAAQAVPGAPADRLWWHAYPTIAQGDDLTLFLASGARVDITGVASDPTWGPYAQTLSALDGHRSLVGLKREGARLITWIEGFGDCMLYAVSVESLPGGGFVRRADDPSLTQILRSHWSWGNRKIPQGNTLRWVGLHNMVNHEDFAAVPGKRGVVAPPTYPDGRPATGWLAGGSYPLNARLYDACGSKDINGQLHPSFEAPSGVNNIDAATGKRVGPVAGLWPAVLGKDDVTAVPGLKDGDVVYAGVISVHKDLSAPFWREYVRASVREIVLQGLDGVWCDNYSPWDNFGYPPVQKAFGDWSVSRFHRYLEQAQEPRLMAAHTSGMDVREHLKAKARSYGAGNASRYDDPAWRDRRWLDEPVWNAFKAFRQHAAKEDLAAFYRAIHDEANLLGRPDFCIGGNDIPVFGLGWVQDGWLDMVNTEVNPGWHMGTGSRGIMTPPNGKMAVVYRAALEHQKGPFSAAWYYLNGPNAHFQNKGGIARVLLSEAFANGAFLLSYPSNKEIVGPVEAHHWWNSFVSRNQQSFGSRAPLADVGIVFSPDNQLAEMAPGGFVDMDHQPHIFGHYGWATALIDAHVPYRALPDWKIDDHNLARLKTLILPHVECLEAGPAEALHRWVLGGGRLVISGRAGARRGPAGHFARREHPLFGAESKRLGMGVMEWTADPVGMDYYLQAPERVAILPRIVALTGPTKLVRASGVPSTVSIALWRSNDGKSIFADLVNYGVDTEGETVLPFENLNFDLQVPAGWRTVASITLSPDSIAPAAARVAGPRVTIHLPRLEHFASIRISAI